MNSLAAVPPLILKQSDCHNQGLPAGSDSKECGRPRFDPWVKKIPWRREWLLYSCQENSMVGYSPWGHKELDTTEQLTL